jgi:hypothetical protein
MQPSGYSTIAAELQARARFFNIKINRLQTGGRNQSRNCHSPKKDTLVKPWSIPDYPHLLLMVTQFLVRVDAGCRFRMVAVYRTSISPHPVSLVFVLGSLQKYLKSQ